MRDLPRDLAPVEPSELLGGAPIVVLAPHPDDESLGCGALLQAAFAGQGAHVVCVTDGSRSHPGSAAWPGPRLAARRRAELVAAVERLGGGEGDVTWLGLPDGAAGSVDPAPVAAQVAALCRRLGAARLFTASAQDHHEDHKATARIAGLVRAQCPGLRLLAYAVWSRWDDPDFLALHAGQAPLRLRGEAARARKAAAIDAHASQLGRVVTDDPAGFAMEPAFVDHFVQSDEVFFEVPE